jgi:hypothetical protein
MKERHNMQDGNDRQQKYEYKRSKRHEARGKGGTEGMVCFSRC